MKELNKIELQRLREVSIHKLLGVENYGRQIKIKCPFHSDRTPSCCLYPNNSWHCFGCGSNGNGAIDFVVELGFSIGEAIEELKKYV